MSPAAPPSGRFHTTRWSLVLAAGGGDSDLAAPALTSLCEIYWPPVYAFIRRQGHQIDDARDLTQEFFTRVLEKKYFRAADPNRGRFRSFLCASIRHFLSNERDRATALKRGGRHAPLPLEWEHAEEQYQREPRTELTPERLFDYRWGLVLLERVLSRLREEHRAAGRAEQFERLQGFLTGDAADVPYKTAADGLGMSEGALKVAVHRLRRRYRDTLMEEIAETVSSQEEIDAEIQHLLKAVSL